MNGCAGLLLAAGEGKRLGTPKALVEVNGELLVDRAARVLAEGGCSPVVVVLGAAAPEVTARARLADVVVVVNDDWSQGMGSSLRAGLNALSDLRAGSAVISVVDQPRVGSDVVRRLLSHPSERPAVAAAYDGRQGNPVRLDASIWADVATAAEGDIGARAWMRAHPDDVEVVACDDLGVDDDIDTVDDLARLVEGRRMEPRV